MDKGGLTHVSPGFTPTSAGTPASLSPRSRVADVQWSLPWNPENTARASLPLTGSHTPDHRRWARGTGHRGTGREKPGERREKPGEGTVRQRLRHLDGSPNVPQPVVFCLSSTMTSRGWAERGFAPGRGSLGPCCAGVVALGAFVLLNVSRETPVARQPRASTVRHS